MKQAWYIGKFIFVISYSGLVLKNLLTKHTVLPFRSINELADKIVDGKFTYCLPNKAGIQFSKIKESNSTGFNKIWKAHVSGKNPIKFVESTPNAAKSINENKKLVFMFPCAFGLVPWLKRFPNLIQLDDEESELIWWGQMVRRDWPLAKKFIYHYMWLNDYGFEQKLNAKYNIEGKKGTEEREPNHKIELHQVIGPLYFLSFMLLISAFILCLEIILTMCVDAYYSPNETVV